MSGRSLVQEQGTGADTKHVAGVVVVREQPDGTFRVLALLPGKEITSDDGESSYQFYGNYDIPKGHAKEGEPPLTAALREAGEETGYSSSDLDFRWGQQAVQVPGKRSKVGTFFVAAVNSDPVLRRNPENGMLEHGGFKWVTFDQMVERVGNFWFAAAIPWARDIVESEEEDDATNEGLLRRYIREAMQSEPEKSQVVPESQIYCDMDGVLVDFETSVAAMLNDLLDGGESKGKRSRIYFARLQTLRDELGEDWRAETGDDLNIPVVRSFMFEAIALAPAAVYSKMGALPDGVEQLWPFLNSTGHVVNLLSAPINNRWKNTPTAGDGKRQWAEILSPPPADIIITPARQKAEYATTDGVPNILIDDRASTVDAWNKAGGVAILHRPGDSAGTIRQLQELGL